MAVFKKSKSDGKKPKKTAKKRLVSRRMVDGIRQKKGRLERFEGNPVIKPREDHPWQSKAAFNAAALSHDGKVHVIYRALGNDDISRWGYAESDDGMSFENSLSEPVYVHREEATEDWGEGGKEGWEKSPTSDFSHPSFTLSFFYLSGGGGNGGAEDPRITLIDNRVFAFYTAFDGWGSVRMTMTSISLEDFLNKKWDWKRPVRISPPGEIHKNWVLFPEKINGKFAILHSISPTILIDYIDNLDKFNGEAFIKSIHANHPLWQSRDKHIRGVGPPPLKTTLGWLILYHAMEPNETHRYKLWAMLLDINNPTKILFRSQKPILEPDAEYENNGLKAGVVYSCGALIKDGTLFVYYGGSDTVTCIATANLDRFLNELKKSGKIKLKKITKTKR